MDAATGVKIRPDFSGLWSSASGGRTHTMSPSTDFKSVASADSAIAPHAIKYTKVAEKVKAFRIFYAGLSPVSASLVPA